MPKELFNQGTVDEPSGSDRFALSVPGAVGGKNFLYSKLKEIMRRGAADTWTSRTIESLPSVFQVGEYLYILKDTVPLPFESLVSPDVDPVNFIRIGRLTDDELISIINGRTGDNRVDASAIKNLPIEPAAGGFANNLYLSNVDSDVMGYKTTSYSPDMVEVLVSTSVSAADGEKVVQNYLYPQPVGIDTYPSGLWAFNFFMYLSSANGVTQIGVTYFKRNSAGVETDLFTAWSAEVNDTIQAYRQIQITNPVYAVDQTDRMGARVKIKTTNVSAITVNYVVGDGYGAWLTTPNRIRHNQLRDFDSDPNYQHITATERAQIQLDPSGFDGNLTPSDDTLQKIAQKVDDLQVSTSEVIDVNGLDPYDPTQAYTAGVYRSYVNLSSPDPKFKTPAIYQAVYDVAIGQTPETHPYNPETGTGLWWWFGDTVETTTRATARGYCETTGELSLITGYKHNDSVNVKTGTGTVNVYVFDSASISNTNTVKPADIATGDPGRWVLRQSVGGGEVTDYENIFFETITPDKAYITRGFNWKIASSTEYGGVSTILTSSGTAYTIGATVTAGDYLTVTNTTINARFVAIIQPA